MRDAMMVRPHIALALCLAALIDPLTARAQAPAADRDPGVRARLGVGGEGGWFGTGSKTDTVTGVGALGAYFRAGVQFSDLVAFHLTAAASNMILLNYFRAALGVELSPSHSFSFGTGFTVVGTDWLALEGTSLTSVFIGAPLTLSYYTGGRSLRTGARHGVGFTLTGNIGYVDFNRVRNNYKGIGGGLTLSVGYEVR